MRFGRRCNVAIRNAATAISAITPLPTHPTLEYHVADYVNGKSISRKYTKDMAMVASRPARDRNRKNTTKAITCNAARKAADDGDAEKRPGEGGVSDTRSVPVRP